MKQLQSGLTLGILGGGQLGRMSALAAARLGISVVIFCPEADSPASFVVKETIIAAYDDKRALKIFAEMVDVISYEFENIPLETIDYLNSLKSNSVLPDKKLLLVSQDRLKEKDFLNVHGIETTRWSGVAGISDISGVLEDWNSEDFILKTARFGYDGKGQIRCRGEDIENNPDLASFLEGTKDQSLIMEEPVDFVCEVSVVIARDCDEVTESYGPMLNVHKNHILRKTIVPSGQDMDIEKRTIEIAENVADAVGLVGVLTVEFFVCADGRILVNEIAPRTHNSGHWSIDACAVSQFENHVRSVCGLPLGSPARHSDAVMLNLIGDDIDRLDPYMDTPGACVHLYGKGQARAGRKMGHVTFLNPDREQKEL